MTKITTTFFVFILSSILNLLTAQQYYYWANDTKHVLELLPEKSFVLTKTTTREALAQRLAIPSGEITEFRQQALTKSIEKTGRANEEQDILYWGQVDRSIGQQNVQSPDIMYAAPFFLSNGKEVGLSHFFYVKLKLQTDYPSLEKLAGEYNVEIEGHSQFMPLWYILSCTKRSGGNALEMANLFYESGLFASSQPDLMVSYKLNSASTSLEDIKNNSGQNYKHRLKTINEKPIINNSSTRNGFFLTPDPYYQYQWNLSNTGQYGGVFGNDINIEPAWNITTGCSTIVVAVLDEGLEFNHPDFNNILSTSYDAETGTSPSQIHGNHGVPVAGIIGATANNGIGVAGVASDIKLMSISAILGAPTPLMSLKLADGINFAWQNGAHVINNSWASDAITSQQLITDAIDDAVFLSRGGLGSVVVFATGNDNVPGIYFPSTHSEVLAVGAMSMCNERKHANDSLSCDTEAGWGSNYGTGLDVMAPGVLIPTTDLQGSSGYNPNVAIHKDPPISGTLVPNDFGNTDYTIWFNGTSSAAPQASGIAALILSVNPGLYQQQVRDIIINTADKVGSYTYTGGWNDQMGYGRVNAYNAVKAAIPALISGPSLVCNSSTAYSIPGLPPGATVQWSASPTGIVIINSPSSATTTLSKQTNGTVTIQATITVCGKVIAVLEKENIVVSGTPYFTGTYNSPSNLTESMAPTPPKTFGIINPACVAFGTNMSLPTGSSINWSVTTDAGAIWGQSGSSVWVNFSAIGQKAYLHGTVTNACGSYAENFIFECISLLSCGLEPQFAPEPELKTILSPNPVSNNLNVELEETNNNVLKKINISEVHISDQLGNILITKKFGSGQRTISLNVASLTNGTYTILVYDGKKWTSSKFIKH